MIDTNYSVEALDYLLVEECLPERYYPLIQHKKELITKSLKKGYKTKNDILKLFDDELMTLGLKDEKEIKLMQRFLKLYDSKPIKFKEILKLDLGKEEKQVFEELYYLPGVKHIRASLYYRSGYKSLEDIAKTNVDEVLKRTAVAISKYNLSCIVPLPKEIRTHIVVAKAFTENK